eukprot:jgi/Galph1/3231/GphlegSOOS_G1931.1
MVRRSKPLSTVAQTQETSGRYKHTNDNILNFALEDSSLQRDSSFSESSSEDENAERLSKKLDSQIVKTYELLKNRDPLIYDKEAQFYDNEGSDRSDSSLNSDSSTKRKEEKKAVDQYKRTKDSKRNKETQKEPGHDKEDRKQRKAQQISTSTFDRGQLQLKQEISSIMEQVNSVEKSDDEEDFLQPKTLKDASTRQQEIAEEEQLLKSIRDAERNKTADEYLLHSYLEKETPDEAERFLRDYVLNNGWMHNAGEAPALDSIIHDIDIDADEEFIEKQEQFEAQHNFRFEEPNAVEVVSYGRNMQNSSREKDNRRKRKRERRENRKKQEKAEKAEDMEQKRNEKKEEIMTRLKSLLGYCKAHGFSYESFLQEQESLDANQHRQKIEHILGDRFEMQLLEDDCNEIDCVSKEHSTDTSIPEICKSKVVEIDRLIDEYFELDFEDIVSGTPIKFRYRTVEPENFGLDVKDILETNDTDLNRIVPMKYVASYELPSNISRLRQRAKWLKKQLKQKKRLIGSHSEHVTGRKGRDRNKLNQKAKGETKTKLSEKKEGNIYLSEERKASYSLKRP